MFKSPLLYILLTMKCKFTDVDFEVFNFYQPKHSKCSEEIKERKKAETNGSKGLSHSSRIPTLPSHSTTLPQVSPSMKTLYVYLHKLVRVLLQTFLHKGP